MEKQHRTRLIDFIRDDLARGRVGLDVERDSLIDTGVIDSLGIMKLVQFIERELRVSIGDDELLPENFDTITAIERLLDAKRR